MTKKITKKEMFTQIIADLQAKDIADKEEKIAFLEKQIELVSRKRTSTKTEENSAIAEQVIASYSGQTVRASDIMTVRDISSTSKATSILKLLVDTGRAEVNKEKSVSYYTIF